VIRPATVQPALGALAIAALWAQCAWASPAGARFAGRPAAAGAMDSLARLSVFLVSPTPAYRLPTEHIQFGPDERDQCLKCHGMPNFIVRDSVTRYLSVDGAAFRRSVHGKLDCTRCHGDIHAYPHEFKATRPEVGCDADCHARDAKGQPIRHDAQLNDFRAGAHRRGLTGEITNSPSCIYCHGAGDAHAVARARQALSQQQKMALCAPCHDDAERMAQSGVDTDAVASYRRGFHYKAIRLGSTRSAVCQDCHAVHRVISPRDTASTVFVTHLTRTCGQENCHPNAGMNFARSGTNHLAVHGRREPVLAAVHACFVGFGVFVVVLLGSGVLLDARRRIGRIGEPRAWSGPLIVRMSLPQRLQHWGMMASFLALVLTGLPLRFPDVAPLRALYGVLGGLAVARVVHRAAAIVMIAVGLAHLGYALVLLARARFDIRSAWTMLPAWKDARDWWETSMYYVGRRSAPPDHGRYHFREKLHYFAVLSGLPIMTLSGLVLWLPDALASRLPRLALGIAYLAHGDEAMVAVTVFVVWHMYNVHFGPGAYYRMMTWLDGRIHFGEWMTQHRLEAESAATTVSAPACGDRRRATGEAP
jgi:formate dehydrogenase subunit gamma